MTKLSLLQDIEVVVCDDEVAGIKVMQHLLAQLGVEKVTCFQDPVLVMRYAQFTKVDLAFLDINMPKLNGINLAKQLDKAGTNIVFVTAYANEALNAYQVDALDFLTKPVSPERLLTSIARFSRRSGTSNPHLSKDGTHDFVLKEAGEQRHINSNDIIFIQSADKYVVFHCLNENFVWRKPLSELEQLVPDAFVRIHRSTIINRIWLDRLTYRNGRWWAVMMEKTELPIGKRYKPNLNM